MSQVLSGSLSSGNKNLAILSDEFGVGQDVPLFSATNCSKAGKIASGTRVTVLGNSGFSGYVLVMTERGDVFEVWHETVQYSSPIRGSKSTLN